MAGQRREPEQRINCFLMTHVFQGDLAERMTRSTAEGRWSTDDYESAPLAAAELETRDVVYAALDLALVTEVLQALTGNAEVRNAMTAAGLAPAGRADTGRSDAGAHKHKTRCGATMQATTREEIGVGDMNGPLAYWGPVPVAAVPGREGATNPMPSRGPYRYRRVACGTLFRRPRP